MTYRFTIPVEIEVIQEMGEFESITDKVFLLQKEMWDILNDSLSHPFLVLTPDWECLGDEEEEGTEEEKAEEAEFTRLLVCAEMAETSDWDPKMGYWVPKHK